MFYITDPRVIFYFKILGKIYIFFTKLECLSLELCKNSPLGKHKIIAKMCKIWQKRIMALVNGLEKVWK